MVDAAAEIQLAEAVRWLGERAGPVRKAERLASGMQSRVWRVSCATGDGEQDYAVKCFRSDYPAASAGSVSKEYHALAQLSDALAAMPPSPYAVSCPTPIHCWPWGYAMTTVTGVPLDRALAGWLPAGEIAAMAGSLTAALAGYHAVSGAPYGDFHSGNVLLREGRSLCLLDPTAANTAFFSFPDSPSPMAIDVGYWLYSVATRLARHTLTEPAAALQRARLARALHLSAVDHGTEGSTADDVRRCVRRYRARLATRGRHDRMAAALAAVPQHVLTRAS